MTFNKCSDLILGVALVLGSIFLITVLIPYGVEDPGRVEQIALAPDFWIKIIGWAVFLTGLFIVWDGYKKFRRDDEEISMIDDRLPYPRNVIMIVSVIVVLFIYQQSIEYFGIVLPSMVAILVMSTIAGYRNWLAILPVAALLPVGLYCFFFNVANIPMPLGIFE